MKKAILLLTVPFFFISAFAQNKFGIEKSKLSFFSDGAIEDIKAVNTRVTSIYDKAKGDIAFLVRIKDFHFSKKLMQVHFNEKFMESEKYPKATFFGIVVGYSGEKQGVQSVVAVGKLFIHGVTKEVKIPGTMELQGSNINLKTKFKIRLADYNITIPQVVWQNIAEEVELDLDFLYKPI
jgi:hypothetical protein